MANTFLAAQGIEVGKSLCERDQLETAREILKKAQEAGAAVLLPLDVVVAKEFKANAAHRTVPVGEVAADEMILDVGPASRRSVHQRACNMRRLSSGTVRSARSRHCLSTAARLQRQKRLPSARAKAS